MTEKTHNLALFGHPVKHSLSPLIHQQFSRQFGIIIDYQLIDVEPEDFLQRMVEFFHTGGKGANVTLPHKQQVSQMVTHLSDTARIRKAVNTLSLNQKFEICGDNTDGAGFISDLDKRCHLNLNNKNILILGAGGATQGIVPSIMEQNPSQLVIANRTLSKAENIAIYANSKAIDFDHLSYMPQVFDLIVHSSSLGHQGETLVFDKKHCHETTICYDLSYGKAAIPFLNLASSLGVTKKYDGIGMLIEQAALSFEIWFGLKPDTKNIKI
jgi:shikimate dehydrogenase